MHAAAQSVHEYVWCVKWDQGERSGWLGRSNSHLPGRESCLTSGLPTCWHACKLPHWAIDLDVAFWYDYLSPVWMHWARKRRHFSPHFFMCLGSKYIFCLFGFYGISTFVSYLMPNPFLYKWTVLFQTIVTWYPIGRREIKLLLLVVELTVSSLQKKVTVKRRM